MAEETPTAETTPDTPAPEEKKGRAIFTARTIFSALIYGAVGAVSGYFLGKVGDNPHTKGSASTVLGWMGGLGGAILAAYTSTKTARRETREEQEKERVPAKARAARGVKSELAPPPVEPVPGKPEPHVDSVERVGTLAQSLQQLAV